MYGFRVSPSHKERNSKSSQKGGSSKSILIKFIIASVQSHTLVFGCLRANKVSPQFSLAFDINESPTFT